MDVETEQPNKPAHQPLKEPREFSQFFSLDLEKFSKAILLVTGLLYILGLVTVNRYLFSFGLSEFSLLNVQYIYTGTLMAILPVLTVGCFLVINVTIAGVLDPPYELGSNDPFNRARNRLITIVKILRVLLFIVIPCLALYLIPFAGQTLNWLQRFWETILLCASAFMTGFLMLLMFSFAALSNSQSLFNQWVSNKIPIFYLKAILILCAVLFFIPFFIWYQGTMIEYVYPYVPQQFGGGQPTQAKLQLDESYVKQANELGIILPPGETLTPDLEIIFEGGNLYVLRLDDDKIVHISKDVVKGLVIEE